MQLPAAKPFEIRAWGLETTPTVLHREMETILIRALFSLKKIETDLLGSWWP